MTGRAVMAAGRAARTGVMALAITGVVGVAVGYPAAAGAAPLSCRGAAASPAASQAASVPTVPPVPTEAAIAPEVNPPGDIPDNQAFVTYTSAAGGYAIAMPEGWARTESEANVTFVDKLHRFSVEVGCADAAPTVDAAKTIEAASLAARTSAFELVEVVTVDLPAGPAVLIRYRMNSAPDEVTGKQTRLDVDRYELFKNGRHLARRAGWLGQRRRLQPGLAELPMDGLAALEAHDLYRFYHVGDDETLALRGVSLHVAPGETVAVAGPSGSGKSTLLACLAGLDEPDGGWVAAAGDRLTRRPQPERARVRARRIGVLLQTGNLLNQLTVRENLLVAMTLAGRPNTARVSEALFRVDLAHRAMALPAQLSGGELARAGLALALINDPAILLADEPTGEVDAENERRLLALLAERARQGGAALIVTHSPAVAAAADRTLHLIDGRLSGG